MRKCRSRETEVPENSESADIAGNAVPAEREARRTSGWGVATGGVLAVAMNAAAAFAGIQVARFLFSEAAGPRGSQRDFLLSLTLGISSVLLLGAIIVAALCCFRSGRGLRRLAWLASGIATIGVAGVATAMVITPTAPDGCFGAMAGLGEFLIAVGLLFATGLTAAGHAFVMVFCRAR